MMEERKLRELAIPLIKSVDSFNYLLKSHHRSVAVISYYLGKQMKLSEEEMQNLVIAASLHDIGALSIQAAEALFELDVVNPEFHCEIGFNMLSSFPIFCDVAYVILHHHANYSDNNSQVNLLSHILHLADRIAILLPEGKFILTQSKKITEEVLDDPEQKFHPRVLEAFGEVSHSNLFWLDVANLKMEKLLRKIKFFDDVYLTPDNVKEFARMLSRVIDFRSKYTATHSYSVSKIAYFLAQKANLSEEVCDKIEVAGLLHDIGKIGIEPQIIEKQGKLDDYEFSQMKLHPYYTGLILGEVSIESWFVDITNWAENHHEKKDGSGYPRGVGLKDEIEYHIVCYADIFTALLENRAYRKKYDLDQIMEILGEVAPIISEETFKLVQTHRHEIYDIVHSSQTELIETFQKEERKLKELLASR